MTIEICGMPMRREPRLVIEDPAEVVPVRERPRLVGKEDAADVDEIDARQAVLHGDLLGPDVLLDRHREISPALDRRVVGHHQHLAAVDDADPGDHPGPGRLVVVHPVGGEGAELEERRPPVEEPVQPLADEELFPGLVELSGLGRPACLDLGQPLPVFGHDPGHGLEIVLVVLAPGIDLGFELRTCAPPFDRRGRAFPC